jgi:hypothetical protein
MARVKEYAGIQVPSVVIGLSTSRMGTWTR